MSGGTPGSGSVAGITVPYRVRFDECGPDGRARASAILRYVQDVAWVHSEQVGLDRAWYAERELAWVVRAVELELLEPITLGATIELTTAVVGFRKVWARRRTEGRVGDGRLVLSVHTDWVMTDTRRGLPVRISDEFPRIFGAVAGPIEPSRVDLPAAPPDAARRPIRVRRQDLDPAGHVNNAAYADYLDEALEAAAPEAAGALGGPRRIELAYLAPALPGATVVGETWPEAPGHRHWAWRLADEAGRELARARVSPAR